MGTLIVAFYAVLVGIEVSLVLAISNSPGYRGYGNWLAQTKALILSSGVVLNAFFLSPMFPTLYPAVARFSRGDKKHS